MNKEVLISYLPLYKDAFLLTLRIGFLGILLSFLIGLASSAFLHFKTKILSTLVKAYIELFRNTPLLIQLFFIYFSLPRIGIRLSPFIAGTLGLALHGGAYMAEAFRSGFEAVEKIQKESALSLGLDEREVLFHIVLPEAVAISTPALVANTIFLLKETSVFSAISLMDLMFTAKDLIGLYYRTTEALFLLVLFYLIMLLPLSFLGIFLEKKVRYGIFGG